MESSNMVWYIAPIYFKHKDLDYENNDFIIQIHKRLMKNNKRIFIALLSIITWWLGGYLFYAINW
jgi:hypothetical protein